ncbi:hypothetical protein JTE90_025476 [Oedothorax gibbosus]|uniref:Uncharacterized protein n=1 Tax=Oedothorax gibbosus TaxID=931172 RepID=A0AAV6UZ44_9ARAC|nr:hypothetical protein JTE90_025476 [Oedothorax gibbosus]
MTRVIKDFSKQSMTNPRVNFDHLLHEYTFIKNTVGSLDEELSFMVFCNTVFSSATMYFSISIFLNKATSLTFYQCLAIVLLFLNSILGFVAMAASATFVSEASAEVGVQKPPIDLYAANLDFRRDDTKTHKFVSRLNNENSSRQREPIAKNSKLLTAP